MARDKAKNAAETVEATEGYNSTPKAENAESDSVSQGSADSDVVYTAEEFARAADTVFGGEFNADIVRAAFWFAGIRKATKKQAYEIVKEFAYKEVK